MNFVLLSKSFDTTLIKIETEEAFSHLKAFLFEKANEYISSKLCSIYSLEIDDNIRWYISLSAATIAITKGRWYDFWYYFFKNHPPCPWILIGKLLIDIELRGQWYWTQLIEFAIYTASELSKTIWIRFIIVDANKTAVSFYEKHWFIVIEEGQQDGDTSKMVFDLKTLDS